VESEHFCVFLFAPEHGIAEDPATGSSTDDFSSARAGHNVMRVLPESADILKTKLSGAFS